MSQTLTQNESILRWLNSGETISPGEAMSQLGCYRLAARINDLKKQGHKIGSRWVVKKNRFDQVVRFKEYYQEVYQ